jgi:hypothetical protein
MAQTQPHETVRLRFASESPAMRYGLQYHFVQAKVKSEAKLSGKFVDSSRIPVR